MLVDTNKLPLPQTDPESVGLSMRRLERLHLKNRSLVDQNQMSGIVSYMTRNGKIVHQDVYGKRNIENNAKMQRNTIFRLYAMTMPITGVAMMMLYEEGKWHPNDLLIQHFPEFSDLKVYSGFNQMGKMILEKPSQPQTLGHILSQTAGFSFGMYSLTSVDKMYAQEKPLDADSTDDFIRRLTKLPLAYHPGEGWVYSVATDIQGALIERLTGMALDEFFNERIFGPLKMVDTDFYVPLENMNRLATMYMSKDDELYSVPYSTMVNTRPSFLSGSGGLYSTADDYVRFLQMLANGGELEGERLLAPSSVKLMCSNQLSDRILDGGYGLGFQQIRPGFGFGYNLGVYTNPAKMGSTTGVGTYTWDGGGGTWFWVDPVYNIVFVGMIQRILSVGEVMPNIQNLSRVLAHQAIMEPAL